MGRHANSRVQRRRALRSSWNRVKGALLREKARVIKNRCVNAPLPSYGAQ
jgi:hypothetical protein